MCVCYIYIYIYHTHTHIYIYTHLAHGRAKERRAARIYIKRICADSGCSPEPLLEAMDDTYCWCDDDYEIVIKVTSCKPSV